MKRIFSATVISLCATVGVVNAAADTDVSRAQVLQELQEAKEAGTWSNNGLVHLMVAKAGNSKSRAEVRQELADAQAAGLVSHGELDYPLEYPTQSSKSRAQVLNELEAHRALDEKFIPW
ncbi:DUF4148 domain-containing protein [Paenalcaligenes niemegkensis]|uniref:DUF4148 domain-containing protein n=1 Tax=Paenalcaligenes niemegkensis TaxID=2895469 RepID=UPI001EE83F12|nr:DUF4148 domain-containing protein [Paenalcaligenes niemegkensis]MCQ9615387.1 DUF4148 domain-containing protein [Paenalcaligenes niemegkensis]